VEQKKLVRKAEPPSKRGIAWPRWTGFRNKTVWDFLQLLIVPLMLAAIGFWFTAQQDARQQQIENQRAEAERELAQQRAQDEAVQAYLDQMSSLLLEKDLRTSKEDSEVRTLARARTLTVLGRLDPSRKTEVMRFLGEADLVQSVDRNAPVISLFKANLSGADLRGTNLDAAALAQADLRDANLFDVDLIGADLQGADLQGANLSYADLSYADLSYADLAEADLHFASLSYADLPNANLRDANLQNTLMNDVVLNRANLAEADLYTADLSYAALEGANLEGANLAKADLIDTSLWGANLEDTVLIDANLEGARAITLGKLERQAKSLQGATLPNGQIQLTVGEYDTDEFEPALSFGVSGGWRAEQEETVDALWIESPEGGQLSFISPNYVFDPSKPSEQKDAPGNAAKWASWFQEHPSLETSKPVSVSVGGASGLQIGVVTDTSVPKNYPRDFCGEQPCIPLFPTTAGNYVSYVEWKERFVIVDVEGETVIIDAAAPEDKFAEFLPKAQKVLDTVEWKSQ
jgi:uncharacterized protein YjbI with pentapeptide repeats